MAVTVTYAYPVAGTTAPTLAQALLCNMITATVNWADADTLANITHNWGLTAVQAANLWPVAVIDYQSGSTTTLPQAITISLTNTNVVTLGKSTVVGGQGTLIVVLMRPFSEIT